MRGHERFDALAGAVVLGEASDAERSLFDDHARTCATCRVDLGNAMGVVAAIDRVRAEETWRPSIVGAVLDRIARSRVRGNRRTIGAFGWAIALSIAVNLSFANGATGWFAPDFHDRGEAISTVVSSRVRFERTSSAADVSGVHARHTRVARQQRVRPVVPTIEADVLAGLDLANGRVAIGERPCPELVSEPRFANDRNEPPAADCDPASSSVRRWERAL